MVKEYAQRAGLEMERAVSIHRRLWLAWKDGGLRAVELEHAAIVDEMQLELAQELLVLPGVRVAHGLVQAASAEGDFERGTLQGRATFQLLEDLALFYGLRAGVARATAAPRKALWTATRRKTPAQNAFRHFKDHGADFGARNPVVYARQAQQFLRSPPPGTLTRVRANGDVVRYNPGTNTFGVMDASGAPRTFLKPDTAVHGYPTNLEYFYAQ